MVTIHHHRDPSACPRWT